MRVPNRWIAAIAVALLACMGAARAEVVYSSTVSLTSADPTQLGRLSRNVDAQDWTGFEAYPGVVNPAIAYHYRAITIDLDGVLAGFTPAPYIQISIDSESTSTFLSAYLDVYDPLNKATNWLGDAGTSGNIFGNPRYFQVIVPTGHDLVLLFNETGANAGLNTPASLLVEAFQDVDFTEPVQVLAPLPEPASLALVFAALVPLAVSRRRALPLSVAA